MARSAFKVETEGFGGIENFLDAAITSASKASLKGVKKVAEDVAFVAHEMAPMDTGALQNSIRMDSSAYQDLVAIATVGIDSYAINNKAHKWVTEYADEAHEEITPSGDWKLGPLSEAKQEMVSSYDGIGVGGGFMTRAMLFCAPDAPSMIAQEIRRALEKYNR